MPATACPILTQRFRAVSRVLGLAAVAALGLGLALWSRLSGPDRAYLLSFTPLTLLVLVVAGAALWLASLERPSRTVLAGGLALVPLGYGLTCLALAMGSVDRLLAWPVPSAQTSLTLLLLGLALLLLDRPARRGLFPGEVLALLALLLPYLALIGHAFNLGHEIARLPVRGMSLLVAFSLALLAVGTLCARPDRGLMARLSRSSLGGSVLRRLVPAALAAPLLLGWLHLIGERAGLFGPELSTALVTLLMSLAGIGLVLWNVETLDRTEAERDHAEQALKESEARYRLVTDYSSDLLTLHKPDGTYLFASPASVSLLGYSPEELVGSNPVGFILEADRPLIEATRLQLMEKPGPVRIRYRVRRKDGVIRWLESTIQDVPAETPGRVEAMLVVSRDVTRRVEAELALRESEDRYRRLVELSPEAIMVDQGGRLIFVNPAGARLIGARSADAVVGRQLAEFVHPDYVQDFARELARARQEGRTTVLFEKKLVRMDGTTVDVETTASPITFGGMEAMLAIIRDITERKQAMEAIARREAELKKATELDRLKDHFLSTLSHEMKTPLSLIVGYSELLEDKYPGEDLVDGIQDGARRLKEHIDSMLDYSALLSGTLPLYPLEVSMPEIVETAVAISRAGRLGHKHPIEVSVDPATPVVTADPRRLNQILVELLDNAGKFTSDGRPIGVQVRPVDGQVQVVVWDTGPGIGQQEIPLIWEAFGQLAIGNATRKGGLGLGLTIARKLAELHGGSLEVDSTPGEGSRFTLTLPVAPQGDGPPQGGP